MKSLIAMLVLSNVSLAYSASRKDSSWVITSPTHKRVLSQDTCARSALEAAASLVAEEIKEAGVDFPNHLYLSYLHVSSAGRYYSITFKSDSSILVQTRRYGMGCRLIQVGRIGLY